MRSFPAFFILEVKRFFSKRNIVIMLLFLMISLYFVQDGIAEYQAIVANKERFKEIERMKVAQYAYYNQYGSYGFRLLFIPSPLSVFFVNSSTFLELISHIDSGEILKIYHSFKGRSLFSEKAGGFKDFSGLVLLFGSLFVLWYGAAAFLNREYLRFLSGFSDYRKIFWAIMVSKIVIVTLFALLVLGLSVMLIRFNHLALGKSDAENLLVYFFVMLLMLIFFLFLGAVLGTLKSRYTVFVSIIAVWFGFVFLLPGIVSKVTAQKADNITSDYHLEFEKLRALMQFERRAIEKVGRFNRSKSSMESARELLQGYQENEFKTVQALENKMAAEMKKSVLFYQRFSLLSPSTFYLATNNEIGSRGYGSVIDFYAYIRDLKQEFVRFYIDRIFSEGDGKVESFIRDEENIFYGRGRVPALFGVGAGLNIFYIIVVFTFSYFRFKRALFAIPDKEITGIGDLKIKLEKGRCTACITSSRELRNLVYNFFCGQGRGFGGTIEIDGVEVGSGERKDFVYLCHPESIPHDIRAGDFMGLFKRLLAVPDAQRTDIDRKLDMKAIGRKKFGELDAVEKGDIMFAAAGLKRGNIYIIDEIERGMPQNFTNGLMENLRKLKKESKAFILYLSSNLYFTAKVSEKMVVPGGERIENILK